MTPNFRFIPHTPEGQADKLPVCRAGDGLGDGGFSDAGRTDQAQDRTFVLLDQGLYGQIFKNPLLDLLQPVMILFQNGFGFLEGVLVLRFFKPGHVQEPVDIIAGNRRFRGHGRHHLQFFDLRLDLFLGLLGHLLGLQLLLELRDLAFKIVLFAHLFLDGPHLLVQIIILLGLFHLLFDAALDLLLDLKDLDLAQHQLVDGLEPGVDIEDLQDPLLVLQLDPDVGNNDIRQLRSAFDGGDRSHHFDMNLLAQLHIGFKGLPDAPHQGFRLDVILVLGLLLLFDIDHEKIGVGKIIPDDAPLFALHQNLDGSVRKPEELDDDAERPDPVDVLFKRLIFLRILLCNHENSLLVFHGGFERGDGLLAAHKKRDNHMGKDDHIPQGQHGNGYHLLPLFLVFHEIKHMYPVC